MDHDLIYQDGRYENEGPGAGVDWRKIVTYASFGLAAVLFLRGKRTASFAAAGVGLATLASDHPEKLQELWERAPEYLEKGHRLMNSAQHLIERVIEQGEAIQSLRHGFGRGGADYRTNSR